MKIAIVGLAVAGVLAVMYFIMKKKEDEDVVAAPVDGLDFFEGWDEFKTPEEIITSGAVNTTKEALLEAQLAEFQAQLDQNAVAVRDYEKVLAEVQAQAILDAATASYSEIAAQREAEAREARARLEAQWNIALSTAQSAMERAKLAADDAWAAYSDAYSKYFPTVRNVEIWILDVARLKRQLEEVEAILAQDKVVGITKIQIGGVSYTYTEYEALKQRRNVLEDQLWDSMRNLDKWRDLRVSTHNVASRCKSDAVHAISNANDCIERVLTITADIRLLGILLSLCDRADSIASATRTKLGQLESKMSAMAL